ncbi:hypothetical protein [Spirosoma koreense]
MKSISLIVVWVILLSHHAPLVAQQTLTASYVTNSQFSGHSLQGFSLSYQRALTPKWYLGVTAKYWKYVVIPYDDRLQGLAIDLHQYPLMGMLQYRFLDRRWQPYLGVETGLLLNSFKDIGGNPIQNKVSLGAMPKVGLRWVKAKIGVFIEAGYFMQSSGYVEYRQIQHFPFPSSLPLYQVGIHYSWP